MHLFKTITLMSATLALLACSSKKTTTKVQKPTQTSTPTKNTTDTTKSNQDLNTNNSTDTAKKKASLGEVIYFEFDSSTLADEARKTLDNNATWLKENNARVLTIEGHTDETGTAEYNLGLGQRRATAARKYLVSLGIDAKRIRIITYGEEKPVSKVDAKNRRSVFIATKKKK